LELRTKVINLNTAGFPEIIDLSKQIDSVLKEFKFIEGLLTVFVPGSTAGITTIEYEPGLLKDIPALCEKLAPQSAVYAHNETWHDGNGFSHVLAALFKPSLSIPFADGKPILGTWQQVVLADFDNRPRQRQVVIQLMGNTEN
jgi:secondary thiamine-phosphate synthase enzyme